MKVVTLTDHQEWSQFARDHGCNTSLYSTLSLRAYYRAYFKGCEVGRFARQVQPEGGSGYINTDTIRRLRRKLKRKKQ
jgi:hypothetical protein